MSDRKRIAIDIDGTLTEWSWFVNRFGPKYLDGREYDYTKYDLSKAFGVSKDMADKIWTDNKEEYLKFVYIKENASEIIDTLSKDYDIYIITNRGWDNQGLIRNWTERDLTHLWLTKHNIKYKDLIFNRTGSGKGSLAKELDIDYFIEDAGYQAEDILAKSEKTKVLLVKELHNTGIEGATYFTNWSEVPELINQGD